uniref:type IV secretion system protein n=1 Tax=Acidovorax sp. SUPP3334 TaxID=2920881 RepID=UPI0029529374|nr:type IV secretion system protein [Acidovorax sp. SUPP3334]
MNCRKFFSAVAMGFMLIFAALPARAGVPVLDAANLANTAQQVIAWAQQAQDMVQQINKLQQQFQQLQTMTSKLEGIRNLGTILNDPQITAMLPPEMRDASRLLLDPKALVTSQANLDQIMSSFGITGSGNAGKSAADTFGRAQQILASTQSRSAQLTQLANRVNVTTDAKDSLDMVNRNVLESASINNQMMQTMASLEAARQATEMKRLADDQQFFKNLNSRAGQPLKSYAY